MAMIILLSQGPGAVDQIIVWDASKKGWEIRRFVKTYFAPCLGGTAQGLTNTHGGWRVDADGESAVVELYIPDDFGSLIEAKVVYIALGTVTGMAFNVNTSFASHGEANNTHTDSTTVSRNTTANALYEDDISAALDGIAKGDYVGVRLQRGSGGNTNADFLGIMIVYEASVE